MDKWSPRRPNVDRHDIFIWAMLCLFLVVMVVGSFLIHTDAKDDTPAVRNMTVEQYALYYLNNNYHPDNMTVTSRDTFRMDDEYTYYYFNVDMTTGGKLQKVYLELLNKNVKTLQIDDQMIYSG